MLVLIGPVSVHVQRSFEIRLKKSGIRANGKKSDRQESGRPSKDFSSAEPTPHKIKFSYLR